MGARIVSFTPDSKSGMVNLVLQYQENGIDLGNPTEVTIGQGEVATPEQAKDFLVSFSNTTRDQIHVTLPDLTHLDKLTVGDSAVVPEP